MKKKIAIFSVIILLTIGLMLIMSNDVLATELSKVEITVPHPIIGKTLATTLGATVKADGINNLKIVEISWLKYNNATNEYGEVTNTSAKIQPNEKYQVVITYGRPIQYQYTDATSITVNGKSINKNNFEEFNQGSTGDAEYEYDIVVYTLGESNVEKNLSKVEITVPEPTIGKTLATASEITVKADSSENLKIKYSTWLKYDNASKEYKEVTDTNTKIQAGEKYSLVVCYGRPNKYGNAENIKISFNGNQINTSNLEAFNPESIGDTEFNYDVATYSFAEIQAPVKEETTQPNPSTGTTEIPSTSTSNKKEETKIYDVIKGENQTFTQNSDNTLEIKIDADSKKLKKVYVDEKLVDKSNYTIKSGSTIIIFNEEYLNTLLEGEHTIKAVFEKGTATTKVTIAKVAEEIKETNVEDEIITENIQDNVSNEEPIVTNNNKTIIFITVGVIIIIALGVTALIGKRSKDN